MLDESKRTTILVLREQGHSIRAIARAVKVSRDTVQRVLAAGAPAITSCTTGSATSRASSALPASAIPSPIR